MSSDTDYAALDALYPLPPEELFRQWVLTREASVVPSAWNRRSFNGWHLGAHPDARVCDLRARDGTLIGWAVEPLLYLDATGGTIPTNQLTLPVDANATPADIERALYGRDEHGRSEGTGLEGTWTAIVFGGSGNASFQRVYLGATHSVVYSPRHRIVATSHNLIPGLQRDEELSRAFDALSTNTYFTFGLTPFVGLHRLLPNHYLDLDAFEVVRHWPRAAFDFLTDGMEGAAAIVEHSRRILDVLTTAHRNFHVFLSAGRDSRAVLALLRPLVQKGIIDVSLSTSYGRDLASRMDAAVARRLARIAGLPHRTYRRTEHKIDRAAVQRAFVRIGEARAGKRLSVSPDGSQRPEASRFKLGGMAGETARRFYWPQRRYAAEDISPEFLAKRIGSPATETVIEAADAWLRGLPRGVRVSAADTLDLAYVEQRLGCWEFASRYLFSGPMHHANPMTAAFNIETMLRLPEDYRADAALQRDMVTYGWPELLALPFNEPVGVLRVERKLRYIAHRITRYMHKMMGRLAARRDSLFPLGRPR